MSRAAAIAIAGIFAIAMIPAAEAGGASSCDPAFSVHRALDLDMRTLVVNWSHVGLRASAVVCVLDAQDRLVHVDKSDAAWAGHFSTSSRLVTGTYTVIIEVTSEQGQKVLEGEVDLAECAGITNAQSASIVLPRGMLQVAPVAACSPDIVESEAAGLGLLDL